VVLNLDFYSLSGSVPIFL